MKEGIEMAEFRNCPTCGVKLQIPDGKDSVICGYCHTTVRARTVVPTVEIDKYVHEGENLCEEMRFSQALSCFERANKLNPDDPRVLWGIIRCKYCVQILYEDNAGKLYALCTRRVVKKVKETAEYARLQAHEPADKAEREYIKKITTYVRNIESQQNALAQYWNEIAAKDDRVYDVFICYKETERFEVEGAPGTYDKRDSVDKEWVHELYARLVEQIEERGLKIRVFFAPVSLGKFVGDQFSAGITQALSTARVMLLAGSRREYFDTTWMLNERTRFLRTIEVEGLDRKIIPLYNPERAREAAEQDGDSLGGAFNTVFPEEFSGTQYVEIDENDPERMERSLGSIIDQVSEILAREDPNDPYRREKERRLREKDAELKELRQKAEADLKEARKESERLQRQLQEAQTARAIAEERLEKEQLRAEKAAAEARAAVEKAELEAQTAREDKKTVESDLTSLNKLFLRQGRDLARAEDKRAEMEEAKEKAEADLKAARAGAEKAQSEAEQAQREAEQSKLKLAQAQEKLRDLQEKLQEAQEDRDVIRQNLENAENQLKELRKSIKELQAKANNPETGLRIAELEEDLKKQMSERMTQGAELTRLRNDLAKREKRILELEKEIDELRKPVPTPNPIPVPPPAPVKTVGLKVDQGQYGLGRVRSDGVDYEAFGPVLQQSSARKRDQADSIYVTISNRGKKRDKGTLHLYGGRPRLDLRMTMEEYLPQGRARRYILPLNGFRVDQIQGSYTLEVTSEETHETVQAELQLDGRLW